LCQRSGSIADEKPQRVGGPRNKRATPNAGGNSKNLRKHGCGWQIGLSMSRRGGRYSPAARKRTRNDEDFRSSDLSAWRRKEIARFVRYLHTGRPVPHIRPVYPPKSVTLNAGTLPHAQSRLHRVLVFLTLGEAFLNRNLSRRWVSAHAAISSRCGTGQRHARRRGCERGGSGAVRLFDGTGSSWNSHIGEVFIRVQQFARGGLRRRRKIDEMSFDVRFRPFPTARRHIVRPLFGRCGSARRVSGKVEVLGYEDRQNRNRGDPDKEKRGDACKLSETGILITHCQSPGHFARL